MPALDSCHDQIVRALEKTGWQVIPKPYKLPGPINSLLVDIEARRIYDGFEQEIIVVEVKCFQNPAATMHDIYVAIGQYLVYREIMDRLALDEPLYLAIPTEIYGILKSIASNIIAKNQIKMMLVNLNAEVIEQWLE